MPQGHRRVSAALLAVMMLASGADGAEIASDAGEAGGLLSASNADGALVAFDDALARLWLALPLQARVALFADSVAGFGNYRPRAPGPFRPGDRLMIYFEPVGYGFMPSGDGFRVVLAVDTEIRTPGGLVLGKAQDFARLEWSARSKLHEIHATVSFALPKLKPGDYELVLTLRDQASRKTTALTLPFSIAGEPPLQ